MKAVLVIDAWKLDIFNTHLKDANFSYEKGPGLTANTLTLSVTFAVSDAKRLEAIVRKANNAATRTKGDSL
jgi:hypothetical protein